MSNVHMIPQRERSKLKKKNSALQGNILPAAASVIVAHGL